MPQQISLKPQTDKITLNDHDANKQKPNIHNQLNTQRSQNSSRNLVAGDDSDDMPQQISLEPQTDKVTVKDLDANKYKPNIRNQLVNERTFKSLRNSVVDDNSDDMPQQISFEPQTDKIIVKNHDAKKQKPKIDNQLDSERPLKSLRNSMVDDDSDDMQQQISLEPHTEMITVKNHDANNKKPNIRSSLDTERTLKSSRNSVVDDDSDDMASQISLEPQTEKINVK